MCRYHITKMQHSYMKQSSGKMLEIHSQKQILSILYSKLSRGCKMLLLSDVLIHIAISYTLSTSRIRGRGNAFVVSVCVCVFLCVCVSLRSEIMIDHEMLFH